MTETRWITNTLCILLLVTLLSVISNLPSCFAGDSLTVLQPTDFAKYYGGHFPPGLPQLNERPSLFGFPVYHNDKSGQLIYPNTLLGTNDGCSAYPQLKADNESIVKIALMWRGNCTFATKAINAQNALADAIIVINNAGSLVYMGAGNSAPSINTPGMMIGNADGLALINATSQRTVWVSMRYFLPQPDDRVEWDLYTIANDPNSAPFKIQFKQVITAFGAHTLFTPHFKYIDGEWSGCTPAEGESCTDANLLCGNQCTNCGMYCAVDPDHDPSTGSSGMDVVQENLRQTCLYLYGQATNQSLLWWNYVPARDSTCGSTQFLSTCSYAVMQQLGINIHQQVNISDDPTWTIFKCSNTSIGMYDDLTNSYIEDALQWQNEFQPFPPPFLYVNDMPYFGSYSCPDPLSTNCGPLDMICQGFAPGTAPSACNTDPGCPLGQRYDACHQCGGNNATCTDCAGIPNGGHVIDSCNKCLLPSDPNFNKVDACHVCWGDNSTCKGCDGVPNSGYVHDACGQCLPDTDPNFKKDPDACVSSGVSAGTVIAIVVPIVCVVAVLVYLYMRRQQHAVKEDIDNLLRQYLPLEGGQQGIGSIRKGMQPIPRDEPEHSMLPRFSNVASDSHESNDL